MTVSDEENNNSEQGRLLSNGQEEVLEPGTQGAALSFTPPLTHVVLYFMAIHFLLAFCEMILVAALIKLFENSLCLAFYDFPVGGIEESLCKVPEIQGPLATIRGWKSSFDMIAGILIRLHYIDCLLTCK